MLAETFDLQNENFTKMADFFYINGFIILENTLSSEMISNLRSDLQKVDVHYKKTKNDSRHKIHKCFFEHSRATVDLIENSKLTDFAQYIIGDVPGARPDSNALTAHVIHNNAFIIPPGRKEQVSSWHVDDPLQQIIIPNNYALPPYIRLPVLNATYIILLSDCDTPITYVVPGSHRYGRPVNPSEADKKGIPIYGKAGTAILVNANVWYRGFENTSTVPRETLQITFARRIIGHKFKTIMNYHMPDHVTQGRSNTLRQRMGFLEGGAYS